MSEKRLSILIPTYNRCECILKNLSLLEQYIIDDQLDKDVEIIVSDNCSIDGTSNQVSEFANKSKITISLHTHPNNIGLERNFIYILGAATTEWVMYLGDDDYLEPDYIRECLHLIDNHTNLGCILANYRNWYPDTQTLGSFRENEGDNQYYSAGLDACIQNTWRAHQISGIVLRRKGLHEEYEKKKLCNLYPQIFMVAYTALRYDVIHCGSFCLRVSSIPQAKKDWTYSSDMLMNDIMQNFKYLDLNLHDRALVESGFNKRQRRYYMAPPEYVNECIENIIRGSNMSLLGKLYYIRMVQREGCYTGKRDRWIYALVKMLSYFYD